METLLLCLSLASWIFSTVCLSLLAYLVTALKTHREHVKQDILSKNAELRNEVEMLVRQRLDSVKTDICQQTAGEAAELLYNTLTAETKNQFKDVYTSSSFNNL